jgi:hypothetical protein
VKVVCYYKCNDDVHENCFNNSELMKWINKRYYIIQRSGKQSYYNTTCYDLWQTGKSRDTVSIFQLFV